MTVGAATLRAVLRRVATGLGLLALAASAVYGGDFFDVRSRLLGSEPPPARPPAVSRVAGEATQVATAPEQTRVRSYPWWQSVDTLSGSGPARQTVDIDDAAIQWRLTWTCESGRLVVTTPEDTDALVEAVCPGSDLAYSTSPGATELSVEADGPWQLHVEQQIDVPLVEPPLPEMTAPDTIEVASGTFYDMDQTGRGQVTIYRLADGRHALRLEEFFATPNVDLEIRLSPLEAPTTTEEYLSAPASEQVARLEVTAGSMNFIVPDGIDPTAYRSVVIWCPPVAEAYTAATLRFAP